MQPVKTIAFWVVILFSAFLLWQVVKSGGSSPAEPEISYSRFLSQIASGQVSKVTIGGSVVHGYDSKGGVFRVIAPPNQSGMLEALQQHDVEVWFKETGDATWGTWLMNLAPLVLLAALWFFMIRQMRSASKRKSGGLVPPSTGSAQDSQPRFGP